MELDRFDFQPTAYAIAKVILEDLLHESEPTALIEDRLHWTAQEWYEQNGLPPNMTPMDVLKAYQSHVEPHRSVFDE